MPSEYNLFFNDSKANEDIKSSCKKPFVSLIKAKKTHYWSIREDCGKDIHKKKENDWKIKEIFKKT